MILMLNLGDFDRNKFRSRDKNGFSSMNWGRKWALVDLSPFSGKKYLTSRTHLCIKQITITNPIFSCGCDELEF